MTNKLDLSFMNNHLQKRLYTEEELLQYRPYYDSIKCLRTQKNLGTTADIFLHAQQIGDETGKNDSKYLKPFTDNIMCSSSDFRYGPADCAKLNEENHVYTGDLMGFKKNRK